MRGRQASLQFVAERTSAWIKDNRPEPGDREALAHADAEVAALQAFVMEAMGDEAPAFSGLLREIREALRQLPKPAEPEPPPPEPEAAPASADPAPGEAPSPAAPAGPPPARSAPALPSGDIGGRSDAEVLINRVAAFFSELSPTSAVPFLLSRALLWGEVERAPEAGLVPPPSPFRREGFATMQAEANHALLITEAETEFTQNPFWLDLQRYLATALKAMGAPAALAHAAVEDATAALVRRLPGLPSLTFQDGTPFADPMTVTWLSDLAATAGGGGGASSVSDEAVREAQAQAAGGDVPGAVAALMSGAGAPRDRFERAVAAAELCAAAGRPDVALGLLDDADTAIETYRLDVWDPAAAAKALRLLYACCTSLKAVPASPQREAALSDRADEAFARLARLDPAHALRSTPAPTPPA
jgi:type VI secretion system protein VasJ